MKDEYTMQDFANAVKNPHVGNFIKNGKYVVIVEHDNYDEVLEVDIQTGRKTRIQETAAKQEA
ncbi:MAG: hypothetical protein FWC77_07035 [Defluviitaleaceae bacterium]|nr:hypothetical protein [Defluviitaleaceae bacterium]